jgi:outer membrane receptor protein involved in Fe transport
LIEDNSVRSKATTLTNLRVGYKVDKTWQAHIDVLNLFNRKDSDIDYYYESRLASEPSGVADIHFHPVEARQFRFTMVAKF